MVENFTVNNNILIAIFYSNLNNAFQYKVVIYFKHLNEACLLSEGYHANNWPNGWNFLWTLMGGRGCLRLKKFENFFSKILFF